jgi:uncharacterized membrane protein
MIWLVSDCEHSSASSTYVLSFQKVIFHILIISGDNRFVQIYTYTTLSLIQTNNIFYSNHMITLLTKVAALLASFNSNKREIGDGV